LYSAHKYNQTFLHARFGLGENFLEPYKETISRWISPDVYKKNYDTSVVKAKQAISDYKKAIDDPAGLVELMVFYCECAAWFCADFGNDDESYYDALVSMFAQAILLANALPNSGRDALIARLNRVCDVSQNLGYGVGDDMDSLLAKHT
ncbi:MAG TPA: hypothetical protein VGV35_02290, partial [Bryobacteraceae bacterium]|nr:hypothetical protein [Bryobacteraceae bacterium]